ncbi:hypothetical protein C8T65DRAFT_91608 [Cerioporus squamosus]|nr:hypothetical protein C8T65DRAFT_91608 [Cerioporus squamosus]
MSWSIHAESSQIYATMTRTPEAGRIPQGRLELLCGEWKQLNACYSGTLWPAAPGRENIRQQRRTSVEEWRCAASNYTRAQRYLIRSCEGRHIHTLSALRGHRGPTRPLEPHSMKPSSSPPAEKMRRNRHTRSHAAVVLPVVSGMGSPLLFSLRDGRGTGLVQCSVTFPIQMRSHDTSLATPFRLIRTHPKVSSQWQIVVNLGGDPTSVIAVLHSLVSFIAESVKRRLLQYACLMFVQILHHHSCLQGESRRTVAIPCHSIVSSAITAIGAMSGCWEHELDEPLRCPFVQCLPVGVVRKRHCFKCDSDHTDSTHGSRGRSPARRGQRERHIRDGYEVTLSGRFT